MINTADRVTIAYSDTYPIPEGVTVTTHLCNITFRSFPSSPGGKRRDESACVHNFLGSERGESPRMPLTLKNDVSFWAVSSALSHEGEGQSDRYGNPSG